MDLADRPYAFVKQQIREEINSSSYVYQLLQQENIDEDQEHVIKWSSASFYAGASDTVRDFTTISEKEDIINVFIDCIVNSMLFSRHVSAPRDSAESTKRNRPGCRLGSTPRPEGS